MQYRNLTSWAGAFALTLGMACTSDDGGSPGSFASNGADTLETLGGDGDGDGDQGDMDGDDANPFPDIGDDGDDGNGEGCVGVSETAQNEISPADILVVVDTSCSMNEEAAFVQNNLNVFSNIIGASGIDTHVVMMAAPGDICVAAPLGSGSCPNDDNPPDYVHLPITVGSSNALQLVLDNATMWRPNFRGNANKHIIVVSDDDSSLGSAAFDSMLKAIDPADVKLNDYTFHGIFAYTAPNPLVCFAGSTDPCCGGFGGIAPLAADEGKVYRELVALTGGVQGNLCLQDFLPVFQAVSAAVIDGADLSCEWEIPPPPAGETLDPNQVNLVFKPGGGQPDEVIGRVDGPGDCGAVTDGWYFDDPVAPTRVLVCPQTCARIQGVADASIDIQFGCATIPAG